MIWWWLGMVPNVLPWAPEPDRSVPPLCRSCHRAVIDTEFEPPEREEVARGAVPVYEVWIPWRATNSPCGCKLIGDSMSGQSARWLRLIR